MYKLNYLCRDVYIRQGGALGWDKLGRWPTASAKWHSHPGCDCKGHRLEACATFTRVGPSRWLRIAFKMRHLRRNFPMRALRGFYEGSQGGAGLGKVGPLAHSAHKVAQPSWL